MKLQGKIWLLNVLIAVIVALIYDSLTELCIGSTCSYSYLKFDSRLTDPLSSETLYGLPLCTVITQYCNLYSLTHYFVQCHYKTLIIMEELKSSLERIFVDVTK